jgi:hypothetical protein
MKSASRDAYDPIETASIDELRALQLERLRRSLRSVGTGRLARMESGSGRNRATIDPAL